MPLSENEQRLLEQMERALSAEDPKFASALQGSTLRERYRRRAIVASVGFVAGVAALMTGLVAQLVPVSILGFVVMLGTAFFAVTSWRDATRPKGLTVVDPGAPPGAPRGGGSAPRRVRRARTNGSFMQRLEERWDRRRHERGF